MDKNLKTLGLNIKIERIKKEISQLQLAELVDASENTIGNIERASQHPSALLVYRIAKVLKVSVDDLFKGID